MYEPQRIASKNAQRLVTKTVVLAMDDVMERCFGFLQTDSTPPSPQGRRVPNGTHSSWCNMCPGQLCRDPKGAQRHGPATTLMVLQQSPLVQPNLHAAPEINGTAIVNENVPPQL